MIELPEASVLASQISAALRGKKVVRAVANESPHRFAWYTGDPSEYGRRLTGGVVGEAAAFGNHVEARVGKLMLVTSTPLRYHEAGARLPGNRQLLLAFADGTALTAHVQMWGAILCLDEGQGAGLRDYEISRTTPSPLAPEFDERYFSGLLSDEARGLSAKAFLATDQRIPGLGNGVLQDVLWTAGVHPKRKMADLSAPAVHRLFLAVKSVLGEMARLGGRDTEKDLFGRPGGYPTVLGAQTATQPCPRCGSAIRKEAYLGGSIYYCSICQALP